MLLITIMTMAILCGPPVLVKRIIENLHESGDEQVGRVISEGGMVRIIRKTVFISARLVRQFLPSAAFSFSCPIFSDTSKQPLLQVFSWSRGFDNIDYRESPFVVMDCLVYFFSSEDRDFCGFHKAILFLLVVETVKVAVAIITGLPTEPDCFS